jgi:hypothetical protein
MIRTVWCKHCDSAPLSKVALQHVQQGQPRRLMLAQPVKDASELYTVMSTHQNSVHPDEPSMNYTWDE